MVVVVAVAQETMAKVLMATTRQTPVEVAAQESNGRQRQGSFMAAVAVEE
jgi:hypothetical protein